MYSQFFGLHKNPFSQLIQQNTIYLPENHQLVFNQLVECIENKLIKGEYVSGVFTGEGTWKFQEENGGTKVKFRWQVSPASLLMKIMATFMNVPKSHSKTMRAGFENLQRHLDNG